MYGSWQLFVGKTDHKILYMQLTVYDLHAANSLWPTGAHNLPTVTRNLTAVAHNLAPAAHNLTTAAHNLPLYAAYILLCRVEGGGAEFLECLNKSECILNGYLVICCWRLRSIGELQPGQADQRDQTRGIEGESSPSVLRSRSVFLPASFFFCWLRRNKKVGLKVTCRLNKSLKTPSYPSH